jgi:hypothetical protein
MKLLEIFKNFYKYAFPLACVLVMYCGTETTNEHNIDLSGFVVYMPDGDTPAPGTIVTFIPRGEFPDVENASVIADNSGHFFLPDTLKSGSWWVYFNYPEGDSLAAWQEFLVTSEGNNTFHDDTLEIAGTVSGTVGLNPFDRNYLKAVVIRILGTTRAVNADTAGNFTLYKIPAGMFTIQCSVPSVLKNYGQLYKPLIRSNARDTVLPDTLKLPYIGLPSVENVSAVFDSVNGVVHLSWDNHDRSYDAMVLRSHRGSSVIFDTIDVISDSHYDDTLFAQNGKTSFTLSDTLPFMLTYRVRLCKKNLDCGDFWESVSLKVESPQSYITIINHSARSVLTGEYRYRLPDTDTFLTKIEFRNKRLPLKKLKLFRDGQNATDTEIVFSPPVKTSSAIVKLHWNEPGIHIMHIAAEGEGGQIVKCSNDSIEFQTYQALTEVQNLKLTYDSLSGVVAVSWNSDLQFGLEHYAVFRHIKNGANKETRIGLTADTVALDTLYPYQIENKLDIKMCQPKEVEYRVYSISSQNDTGPSISTGIHIIRPPRRILSEFDFEGHDSLSAYWEYGAFDFTLKSYASICKDGHNSSRSLYMKSIDSINDIRCQLMLNGLDSGRTYRITCWIKSKNVKLELPPYSGAGLWLFEAGISTQPAIIGTNDWTKCTCTFTADSPDCKLWCRLGAFGNRMSGEVWFDDISIEPLFNLY